MPLPWVRLETTFPQNPKILTLVETKKWQAISVYVAGLAYSGAHGTDGFLPGLSLPFLHGTKRNATDLVDVQLWTEIIGGWAINGWTEFQITNAEYEARRDKAQKAAAARWSKQPHG